MLHGALLSYKYHLENVTIIPTPNGAVPCCSQDHVRRLEHTEIARPKNGELTTLCGRPLQFEVERQRACHGGERMFQSLFFSTLYRFNRQYLRAVTRWRHGSPYSNRDRDQANKFCLAKSPKMATTATTATTANYSGLPVSTRDEDGRETCPALSSIAPRQGRSSPLSQGLPSHSRISSRTLLTPAHASLSPPPGNACNGVIGEGEARRTKRRCQLLIHSR